MKKPIGVLLALYEPNIAWLCELLNSLNAQTYSPLHLYVRDDASPTADLSQIEALLRERITNFGFTLLRNEKNLGSNKTFEALVRDAAEPYIAFCDQDDVWLPEKLARSVELFEGSALHPTMVCTNVRVVDGEGNLVADSMDKHRRRHVFLRGEGIADTLIYRNFAMGCTMLLERERALGYLPFPEKLPVHDHYLAFRAAADGALDYLAEPTMLYRVYGGNQTGVMVGVRSKEDYLRERIMVFDARVAAFSQNVCLPSLDLARQWSAARRDNYARKRGSIRALWRLRRVNFVTTLFELIVLRLPKPLFLLAIKLVQKRIL